MMNIVNVTDWLVFYKNFISAVWKKNNYSIDEQIELINKLLDTTTNNENSFDIINAKSDLKTRLFLLNLNSSQEIKKVISR